VISRLRGLAVFGAALALAAGLTTAAPALAAGKVPPAVLHVGQIDRQDVATQAGCEPDTLVEPDVAVSPVNPNIEVAAAHDCRFSNGGAVDVSYAWTHDGGLHWHHAPLPGLTRAVGGKFARASDPAVAFGPDGSVYIATLVIDLSCPGGVAISKSTNGGKTFGPPVLVHVSRVCTVSDDKDWLVVDNQPLSPFFGRIYVFWTEFLSDSSGNLTGVPQVLRWSDDGGMHWSATQMVTPANEETQNSQPMISPDGTLTDTYLNFGTARPGSAAPRIPSERGGFAQAADSGVSLVARSSFGGASWSGESLVASNIGGGPADIRCCLDSANIDPVTGQMYAVWEGNGPGSQDPVLLSSSHDGRTWSAPMNVTPTRNAAIQHVNADVTAYNRKVFVSYGSRNTAVANGNLVQQEVTSSFNGGASFGPGLALGPASNLRYAAVAGGKFPGDYIGSSAVAGRLALVWCVSSKPSSPTATFHQTVYGAELAP
jgi:hypothetical protein